jgi:zinc and cadmium transporter
MNLIHVFLATTISALAFLAGGLISHRFAHFLARHSAAVIAFATGAMLSITFLHVLPEVAETNNEFVWLTLLAGILFFYFLENFFYLHGCPDHVNKNEKCPNHHFGSLAALGIGIHSFFDGILIVLAFLVKIELGWLTALGIILHKLPAGAILHALICYQKSKKNLWPIFGVAAATPLAALIAPFLKNFSNQQIGLGLAFSAGALLYITLSDLLPETHRTGNRQNLFWLGLGIILIFAITHLHFY